MCNYETDNQSFLFVLINNYEIIVMIAYSILPIWHRYPILSKRFRAHIDALINC